MVWGRFRGDFRKDLECAWRTFRRNSYENHMNIYKEKSLYVYIRVRAPERLISSLGALGRGRRRRRRVLCVFVCLFVQQGRRGAGRDPPTKETLRFCLLGWVAGGPAATHPQRKP